MRKFFLVALLALATAIFSFAQGKLSPALLGTFAVEALSQDAGQTYLTPSDQAQIQILPDKMILPNGKEYVYDQVTQDADNTFITFVDSPTGWVIHLFQDGSLAIVFVLVATKEERLRVLVKKIIDVPTEGVI